MFQNKRFHGSIALALCLTASGSLLAPITVLASGTNTSTPAPPPIKPAVTAARDIKLIEAALGITLTDAQVKAINVAAATRDGAGLAALTQLRTTVAGLFGYTPAQLDAAIKALKNVHPDLISQLKAVLGRDLTAAEKKAVAQACNKRNEALEAAAATYRATVAKIVGLSLTDLETKIRAFLDANRPKPPAPPTTGTGSSGTGTGSTDGSGGDCKNKGGGGDKPNGGGTPPTTGGSGGGDCKHPGGGGGPKPPTDGGGGDRKHPGGGGGGDCKHPGGGGGGTGDGGGGTDPGNSANSS